MSSLFLETLHSLKPHPSWVIATNSNSRLPIDVMSRQGIIDRWRGGTCPNMFEGGKVRARPCLRGDTSPLFIVRVRTLRPDNACVIAIFSKVLPNVISPTQECCQMTSFHPRNYDSSLFPDNVLPMTSGVAKYTLAQYAPFPYYWSTVQNLEGWLHRKLFFKNLWGCRPPSLQVGNPMVHHLLQYIRLIIAVDMIELRPRLGFLHFGRPPRLSTLLQLYQRAWQLATIAS